MSEYEDEFDRAKCGDGFQVDSLWDRGRLIGNFHRLSFSQKPSGNDSVEARLQLLRENLKAALVDGYIVTSYDEHRDELKDFSESPLMFISGLTFRSGEAVVTTGSF
jgi:hypothetical protein